VKSVDYYRQQIDLIAVGGGSEATDDEINPEPVQTVESEAEFEDE
jgi:ribonuclease R